MKRTGSGKEGSDIYHHNASVRMSAFSRANDIGDVREDPTIDMGKGVLQCNW
jgi:hypothetical protein